MQQYNQILNVQEETFPEEAFIHSSEMTAIRLALKDIPNRENKTLDNIHRLQMQFIEFNKENQLILDQMYDILKELKNQGPGPYKN